MIRKSYHREQQMQLEIIEAIGYVRTILGSFSDSSAHPAHELLLGEVQKAWLISQL